MATSASRDRAASDCASSVGCALQLLGASIFTGQVRDTTLATAALYAWRQASNGVIEAGLEHGVEAALRWLQAAAMWAS
jgi:hypothetical protein